MPPFVLLKLFSVPAKWSPAFSSEVQTLALEDGSPPACFPSRPARHHILVSEPLRMVEWHLEVTERSLPMAISATAHEVHEPVQWAYFPRSPRMEPCDPHSNDMDGNHDHGALPGAGH